MYSSIRNWSLPRLTGELFGKSYEYEKIIGLEKIGSFKSHIDKLKKARNKLRMDMCNGTDSENAISEWVSGFTYDNKSPLPTKSLRTGRVDCFSEIVLYVSLAEMLDQKLYETLCYGLVERDDAYRWIIDRKSHVFVRKNEGETYKNIDFGRVYDDSHYSKEYLPIETLKKENLGYELKNKAAWICCNTGMEILEDESDLKKAEEMFSKGLKIFPNHLGCIIGLGRLFEESKQNEKAFLAYDKGLLIYPNSADLLSEKASSLVGLRKYSEAKELCEKVLNQIPNHIAAGVILECCLTCVD
jgi:tetratricopeptide (TPR) repeat protein